MSSITNFLFKKPIYYLMIIWTLTSAEQCTNTDACGAHTSNAFTDKIKLTLVTNIPQGYGRPITQFVVPYINPLININAGFTSTIPRTIFNIKVESYELCADQTPRYRTLCCRTFDQTCSLTNTETTFELPIIWDAYFKNKVTIKAITEFNVNNNSLYAVYIGSFDIQTNQTSLTPRLINLSYLASFLSGPEYGGGYFDYCKRY